ncbi:MAG: hypothetical protein KAU49_02080 [Candidatus Krumholzibacteria bacterium]|nr:hypothetical protein [Candidatus Krumholzibacteria bacterium]
MAGNTKKKADVEALIATFSTHVSENYPAPEVFSENLTSMLAAKKERMESGEYVASLERNLVFLKDLVTEGEALLEYLLERINNQELTADKINTALGALEEKVRSGTAGRVEKVLGESDEDDFRELTELRGKDQEAYTEKLEFNYIYFMAFRMLLFEFFGVMAAIREEYDITRVDEAAFGLIQSNIEMTTNYYLGNISVGEVVDDEPPSA